MFTLRQYQVLRNRAISIGLACTIGAILGVGGYLVWYKTKDTPAETVIEPKKLDGVDIVSHKALYKISLVSAKSGSQLIDIDGKMMFQVQRTCESYISAHRFSIRYDYADTEPLRVTSDFSTVETADGQTFDFTAKRKRDGELYEVLRGTATKDAKGKGGVVYTDPASRAPFSLREGTVFPVEQTKKLIGAAKKGVKFVSMPLFDGADQEGPVDVSVVIGRKMDRDLTISWPESVDHQLLSGTSWRMHMAFFPALTDDETSDYELDIVQQDNGIISDMTISYPDFTIRQTLIALEKLPPDSCATE